MDAYPGFILHSRPWQETSVLLDSFTREHGLIKLVARGVKGKRRSTWSANLQLFVPLLLQFKTRGDWWHLSDVESASAAIELRDDAHLCGQYCNELLLRLLHPHDPHPEIFQHYLNVLLALSSQTDLPAVLRQFEWNLLTELGYGIDLHFDHAGDGIDAEQMYRYHENGLWPIAQSTEFDFSGHDLLYLAEQNWSQAATAAKRLLRLMLQPQLGVEPLKTRELWRQYEALKRLAQE